MFSRRDFLKSSSLIALAPSVPSFLAQTARAAEPDRDGRILTEHTGRVWHAFVPELRPGQLYGFRVEGPYEPQRGLRFCD